MEKRASCTVAHVHVPTSLFVRFLECAYDAAVGVGTSEGPGGEVSVVAHSVGDLADEAFSAAVVDAEPAYVNRICANCQGARMCCYRGV